MDDDKQAIRFRGEDERATQQRAALLGLDYIDTRDMSKTSVLVNNSLSVSQMHAGKLVPLKAGSDSMPYMYGVTSSTPQSFMNRIRDEWSEKGVNTQFFLISGSGYREFMLRYDPPSKVVYDDVEIAKEGDSQTLEAVSKTLESVKTDDILDYLVDQADFLGASDIHVENQRENVRIRFRVDGALHPVANLTHEKIPHFKSLACFKGQPFHRSGRGPKRQHAAPGAGPRGYP